MTSRWCGIDSSQWMTIAEAEAAAAKDGPLLARAWLERSDTEHMAEYVAECPCPERLTRATAALSRAGLADEQASLRAFLRHDRAWELALAGNRHDALVELDAVTLEAQKAGWRSASIHEQVGVGLRVVKRPADAMRSLSKALNQPPVRQSWVHCEIAQAQLALGEADAAAQHLMEAFLLTCAHRLTGRHARIRAVRALLPSGTGRDLDELMWGA